MKKFLSGIKKAFKEPLPITRKSSKDWVLVIHYFDGKAEKFKNIKTLDTARKIVRRRGKIKAAFYETTNLKHFT